MAEPNIIGGVLGGGLIGLAAVLMLLLTGKIAGISGIAGGLIIRPVSGDLIWRVLFILGLIIGAGLYAAFQDGLVVELQAKGWGLILAGLLVGMGTRLGSGCTSGHGVCGLARRSPRSLVATITFISVAMITVFVIRHLLP